MGDFDDWSLPELIALQRVAKTRCRAFFRNPKLLKGSNDAAFEDCRVIDRQATAGMSGVN